MTDNTALLQQRFLEGEGEIGRNFSKFLNKFSDYHTAITLSAATGASASNVPPATTTNPPQPSATDIFQSLLREMANYQYAMHHCKLIQATSLEEMKNYERQEEEIASTISTTRTSIGDLQSELASAKQRRRELEEYESLVKKINTLPSRESTLAEIERLTLETKTFEDMRSTLEKDLNQKRIKYQAVLNSMQLLSTEWVSEDAAAAEEQRRRDEEEQKLNDAILEAKLLANAGGEDVQEEPEEREDEAGDKEASTPNAASSSGDKDGAAAGEKKEEAEEGEVSLEEGEAAPSPEASPVPTDEAQAMTDA